MNRELLLHIGIGALLILLIWLLSVLLDPDERRRARVGIRPGQGHGDGEAPALTSGEHKRLDQYEARLGRIPAGVITRGRGLADACRSTGSTRDAEAARILLAVLDQVVAHRDAADPQTALAMTVNDLTIAAIDLTELARHEPAFD